MKVNLDPASIAERGVIANLMELYLDEFAAEAGREIGEDGRYGYPRLDAYWSDEGRYPFLIRADGRLAGFALALERRLIEPSEGGRVVAEFFVLRGFRRRGMGEAASHALFRRFPGSWLVPQLAVNTAATGFWRAVIGRFTAGAYGEATEIWDGQSAVVQTFESAGAVNPPNGD